MAVPCAFNVLAMTSDRIDHAPSPTVGIVSHGFREACAAGSGYQEGRSPGSSESLRTASPAFQLALLAWLLRKYFFTRSITGCGVAPEDVGDNGGPLARRRRDVGLHFASAEIPGPSSLHQGAAKRRRPVRRQSGGAANARAMAVGRPTARHRRSASCREIEIRGTSGLKPTGTQIDAVAKPIGLGGLQRGERE